MPNYKSGVPDVTNVLNDIGQIKDEKIDLGLSALALAGVAIPERSLERYWHHLVKMTQEVQTRHKELLENGGNDDAKTQLAALKHIIADKHGYDGDKEHYDNIQNANLVHVIDRRKGMPIALSILYLHIGKQQGWSIFALNFPAHVVCTIEKEGERLLFDPFNQCRLLNASDLREYLKTLIHSKAELSPQYYNRATSRDLLIRLQNNIKLRQIEAEDYEGAVQTVEMMRKIDPAEYRFLFDAGILYARIEKPLAAIRALEIYIDASTNQGEREEALAILSQIKMVLN